MKNKDKASIYELKRKYGYSGIEGNWNLVIAIGLMATAFFTSWFYYCLNKPY